MIIDWYTIIFQIINFLVLVFLLRLFLYRPIIKTMDEREQKIVDREKEAHGKSQKAEEEMAAYRRKSEELKEEEEKILEEARSAAGDKKRELLEQARQEVDDLRQRWEEAFKREQEAFAAELRRRVSRQSCEVARRCLEDLADEGLEDLVRRVFIKKISSLSAEEVEKLVKALDSNDYRLHLLSAFPVPAEYANELTGALEELLPAEIKSKLSLKKREESRLICGLEVEAGGYRLSWNIDSYIEGVEAMILKELDQNLPAGENVQTGDEEEETAFDD